MDSKNNYPGEDVIAILQRHAMEDMDAEVVEAVQSLQDEPARAGSGSPPRCLRLFWAWIGAFCASLLVGFVSWIWSLKWPSLAQYRAAMGVHYACFAVMAILILAAVWWKGTIKCEDAACIWYADKARAVREALEAEKVGGE